VGEVSSTGEEVAAEDRRGGLGELAAPNCKIEMTKTIEQWLLFIFERGEFTPLSKPFKTKGLAEKARLNPNRVRRKTGVGLVRVPIQ